MATKRPIATQQIPGTARAKAPAEAATVVVTQPDDVSSDPTVVDDGEQASQEQTAAEATSERPDLSAAINQADMLRGDAAASLTDDPAGGDAGAGLISVAPDRPSEAELLDQLQDTGTGNGEPDQDGGSGAGFHDVSMIADDRMGGFQGGWAAETNASGELTKVAKGPADHNPFFDADFYDQMQTKLANEAHEQRVAADNAGQATSSAPSESGVLDERDDDDGSHTTVYNDGTITTTSPDGTVVTSYPDGTTETDKPDGTLVTENPDGSTQTIHPDGTVDETPSTAQPDPENETAPLPEALQEQLDADLANMRAAAPHNDPGDGAQDPTEGDGAFGTGVRTGVRVGVTTGPQHGLGNPGSPEDQLFGGSGTSSSHLPGGGVTDPGFDAAVTPQTDGRELPVFEESGRLEPTQDAEETTEEVTSVQLVHSDIVDVVDDGPVHDDLIDP